MEQPRGLFTDEVYTARVVDIVYVMPADAFQSVFLLVFGEKQMKSKIQGTVKKLVTDLLNPQVLEALLMYSCTFICTLSLSDPYFYITADYRLIAAIS